jgi:hypothetical protein
MVRAGGYRPRVRRSMVHVSIALVLTVTAGAGCGGSDDAETTGDPGEIEFELAQRNDSGVAGIRAVLSFEAAERTRIRVDGLDEGQPSGGGPNPVRVRAGSCDQLGEVVARLEPLQGTTSEGTVDLALGELMKGDYAVEVALTQRQAETIAARRWLPGGRSWSNCSAPGR